MKIRSVGVELFHGYGRMDGQTDKKKLIVAYRDFAYAEESVTLGKPVMTHGTLQFL